MRHKQLGSVAVTAVGIGDVDLAISEARGVPRGDVERALHHALELGITLVDVSSGEDNERMCGDAVRALRLRDRVTLAIRVDVPGDRAPPPLLVQQRVEASLRASRLEVLPLAMLPVRIDWQASGAWPELVGTCHRLVREGKVQQWGAALDHAGVAGWIEASARTPAPAPPAANLGGMVGGFPAGVAFEALAAGLAIDPSAALIAAPAPAPEATAARALGEPFVAVALRHTACDERLPDELPVLARSPLAGGALAGALGPGVKLTARDDRRVLDAATLERIAVACAELAPLVRRQPPAATATAAARGALERGRRGDTDVETLAELVLRHAIDRGHVVLPRLHRSEHVAAAIAAATAPPLADDLVRAFEDRLRLRDT